MPITIKSTFKAPVKNHIDILEFEHYIRSIFGSSFSSFEKYLENGTLVDIKKLPPSQDYENYYLTCVQTWINEDAIAEYNKDKFKEEFSDEELEKLYDISIEHQRL